MSIRAGFLQYEVRFGDWEHNAATVRRLAAQAQADLLVLPELALTGYDFPDRATLDSLADPFEGGRTAALARDLAAAHRTTIAIGYAESAGGAVYNSALMAAPDGGLYNYRKIHLFNRERQLFDPGDAPPRVYDTPAGRIGLMICFDWFFPETARTLALAGAQILAHPSNLVLPWCQRAMFARAVENGVFAITANRIGTETQGGRALTFTGGSQMLNPRGEALALAPPDAPHIGIAAIAPAEADDKRRAEFNDLFADRRPDLYAL